MRHAGCVALAPRPDQDADLGDLLEKIGQKSFNDGPHATVADVGAELGEALGVETDGRSGWSGWSGVLLQNRAELFPGVGLAEVAVHARRQAALAVTLHRIGRKGYSTC